MSKLISYNGKILADKNGHAFSYAPNSGTINITTNGNHNVDGKEFANVNIPTGTPRSKSDVTISGNNATVPAGLYASPFNIAASELCNSGTKSITENGTGINVTGYSKVDVAVPGIIPSGTLTVTDIGTYDVTNYASVRVWVIGSIILWDNKEWLVCHSDSNNNRVYLIAKDVISTTKFGSNTTYAGSTLAQRAMDYQNNQMSAEALAQCVDVTVNGVTAKVFVPSKEQMQGGFSWFNKSDNRIAYYGSSESKDYWTSSKGAISGVQYVGASGNLLTITDPSASKGFRPCICVQL